MISLALVSGCVSATIDTPQGVVGSIQPASTTEVLSLNTDDALPTPAARPGSEETLVSTETIETARETIETASLNSEELSATPPTPTEEVAATVSEQPDVNSRIAAAEKAPVAGDGVVVASAQKPVVRPPAIVASAQSEEKPSGFLNSLFGKNTSQTTPPKAVAATTSKPPRVIATASATGSGLPGVDKDRALGVKPKTTKLEPIQLASAAGLARLAPNGLRTQHSGVDVKCLKPALVRVLKTVEKRYGKPVVVTSGYRSPKRNASIRGAKNSLHIYCSAADIQVAGVDKWTLAKYLRSLPGRGGVGTYCHTKSVHVDIGPKRDWNWRCRRR